MIRKFLPKPVKKVARKVLSFWVNIYENSLAGILSRYFGFLYVPLYLYYRKKNIRFLVNIAEGVGHILPELDYFFRLYHYQKIDRNKKYIFLRKNLPLSKACAKVYSHYFYKTEVNTLKYLFLLPLLIRFKKITFDPGYCRIKWQAPKLAKLDLNPKHPFLYQSSKQEGAKRFSSIFKLRKETPSFFPLLDFCKKGWEKLQKDLQLQKPFCLIHIKKNICNATAAPTDPKTYVKSLHYLQEKGYQLVFTGREKMPKEFEELSLINYAESSLASFENDLLITSKASLLISGGSGINMLGDFLNIPVLYLNSWHLALQFFHFTSVCVPTVLKDKQSKLIPFSQQVDLAFSNPHEIYEIFPKEQYEACNASSEDIFEGLLELLTVMEKRISPHPLYDRYVLSCNRYHLLSYCESRISSHFLKKYESLY